MDYSKLTLGELLSHANETIRRNATSILKILQKQKEPKEKLEPCLWNTCTCWNEEEHRERNNITFQSLG